MQSSDFFRALFFWVNILRMSRHKKDRKLREKTRLQQAVKEEKVKYDVIELLRRERQDSKPNLGKFLSCYVREIRGCTNGKILLYPETRYKVTKVIVSFLDGHELLYVKQGMVGAEYYMYDGMDEVELKQKDA